MEKIIRKFMPKLLKRFLKNIRNREFFKKIFKPLYLKKALIFPRQIIIETTSFCNARCLHCEYQKLGRPHAHMEMDLYKKIIDECHRFSRYSKNVSLFWIGEPLLDPLFFERVKYAKQKNPLFVIINSNGSLLTPANCQKIIDSKIDKIIFGVDGATKESFEAIRIGLSYQRVVEGIKRLADLKKELNVKIPKIVVRMTVTPSTAQEIDLFKKTWQGIADAYYAKTMHVWGGDTIDKDLIKYSYQGIKEQHGKFTPCFYLWESMIIAQDGRVALCCVDARVQEKIGDLNKETMYDVWRGKRLNQIRKMHLAGRAAEIPICRKCNFPETKEYPWWWYGK